MRVRNCKKEAKACLKSRKLRAIRISLTIVSLSVLFGFASYYLPQLFVFTPYDPYITMAAQITLLFSAFAIIGSLRQGRAAWMYCSACGREPSRLQFVYWLRRGRGVRAALLFLDIRFRKAAWTLLLSAPGAAVLTAGFVFDDRQNDVIRLFTLAGGSVCLLIGFTVAAVINQKYALAPILLARSPHKGVRSAVRGSCSLTEEHCAELFLLDISFLPWAAACLTVLPLLYAAPYYQQARACMLRDILRAHTL